MPPPKPVPCGALHTPPSPVTLQGPRRETTTLDMPFAVESSRIGADGDRDGDPHMQSHAPSNEQPDGDRFAQTANVVCGSPGGPGGPSGPGGPAGPGGPCGPGDPGMGWVALGSSTLPAPQPTRGANAKTSPTATSLVIVFLHDPAAPVKPKEEGAPKYAPRPNALVRPSSSCRYVNSGA